MEDQKDKTKIKIVDLLRSHPDGLTIKEMMDKTGLARHTLLARLHHLEGQDKIGVRQINMAKLHRWKHENEEKIERKTEDVEITPIKEEHIKESGIIKTESKPKIDLNAIRAEIEGELRSGKIKKPEALMKGQRKPLEHATKDLDKKTKILDKNFIKTGVPGFDELLDKGIPKKATILIAGGAGSGKTIFCLQTVAHHAKLGKKCLYMSFEESEEKLISHMKGFSMDPQGLTDKGVLKIQRFNPFDITRNVDALLAKQKGELLIDMEPVILPPGFKPDIIVLDSLTAIASAFTGKDESYRIYIEQLFRFFEKIGATAFLITETEQVPKIFSTTGVEEFLADGVIVFYNIKHGNVRENAIEVLKLRGAAHQKRIVAMQITGKGIVVYPEQEVFSEIKE